MSDFIPKTNFEGAGFLLSHNDIYYFGVRLDSKTQEPTGEIEYMGGKVEAGETPYQTAYNELLEELGVQILDSNWEDRAKVVHIFQPFSKKWIWCFQLELKDNEFQQLQIANKLLTEWPENEKRDFSKSTNRNIGPSRKSIQRLIGVPKQEFVEFLSKFREYPASKNRMKDAKVFAEKHKLRSYCLRGFNTVMFENVEI